MKFRIGDKIIDPNIEPVVIMFEDDNERLIVGGQITNMAPKEGPRAYAHFPDGLTPEERMDHMKETLKLAGYVQL